MNKARVFDIIGRLVVVFLLRGLVFGAFSSFVFMFYGYCIALTGKHKYVASKLKMLAQS